MQIIIPVWKEILRFSYSFFHRVRTPMNSPWSRRNSFLRCIHFEWLIRVGTGLDKRIDESLSIQNSFLISHDYYNRIWNPTSTPRETSNTSAHLSVYHLLIHVTDMWCSIYYISGLESLVVVIRHQNSTVIIQGYR